VKQFKSTCKHKGRNSRWCDRQNFQIWKIRVSTVWWTCQSLWQVKEIEVRD